MTLTDALALFLEAAEADGLAPTTLRYYRGFIHAFIASLPQERQTVGLHRLGPQPLPDQRAQTRPV